ncbi:hypothetical protein [Tumebacillus algifaecis]|uniref:hypothetical protein n=1 Tax=Tumebacillus algifaecis TaxID=1214604 RepID=UPI0012FD2CFF|nr:hypothetical protein [Tumebacillus algifaecis]
MAQLSFVQVEPAMEMVQLAEKMLKDYARMKKQIKILRGDLASIGDGVVGAAGDVNSSIRAQYKNSDKVGGEAVRRDKKRHRLALMERNCAQFEAAMAAVTDWQQDTMLEWLLDGETVTKIAYRLDLSRRQATSIKRNLVDKLAWAMQDHLQVQTKQEVAA